MTMSAPIHPVPELFKRVLAEAQAPCSDWHLLERYLEATDHGAFGEILQRHGPMLLGLCRRQLAARDVAEDVLQATFLVLARKARTIRRRDNLAGWLYGVAQRLVRQVRRTDAARLRRERIAAQAHRENAGDPAWDELLAVLDEELQRLPERYRVPLLLCYLEGRTQDEAALQVGWSLSTLRRRLDHGRTLLRMRMLRRGATLGAGLIVSVIAPSALRAALSADLEHAVLRAASAAGGGTIAPAVLALADGYLRTAFWTKWAMATACAMMAATVTALVWWAGQAAELAPPAAEPNAQARPEVDPDPQPPVAQDKPPAPGHDLFGDPLPKGAIARLGTLQFRHGPYGHSLQFAPDGKHLVSLGGGWIRRWDVATAHADINVGKPWPIGQTISRQMVTADGKRAIICRLVDVPGGVDFACTEYDLETGRAQTSYSLNIAGVQTRAVFPHLVSPDGKLLAGMADDVRLWRRSDGSLAHRLKVSDGRFTAMAFAPDGNTLFVGDDVHTIHVFDMTSGTELRAFGVPSVDGVSLLAVAPDGKRLATAGRHDSFVRLWNVEKGTEDHTLDFPDDGVADTLLFTPDSRTVLVGVAREPTSSRRSVRSWDVATGQPGRAWINDPSIGLVLAVGADGKTLASMNDAGVIRLFDMASGKEQHRQAASPDALSAVAFQADGKTLLTVGNDFNLRRWEAATGRLLGPPRALVGAGVGAAHGMNAGFVAPGRLIIRCQDRQRVDMVRLVDAASGQLVLEAIGREAVLSPDGKLLAASGPEMVTQIRDVATGQIVHSLRADRETQETLRPQVRGFTGDGRFVIVQGEIVSMWSTATGKQRSSWSLYRNRVLFEAPEPKKWKQPKKQPSLRSDGTQLRSVAVSPDGSRIAFGLDAAHAPGLGGGQYLRTGRLMIFETATGKLLHQSDLPDERDLIHRLAFNADGKLIAAGGMGSVRVWEMGTAKEAWAFDGHRNRVEGLAFSADSKRLASASDDSTVLVWDLGR
jgi:RNA polymerase sigma factor (sigma-70 family)